MEHKTAKEIADRIVEKIKPYCDRVEIVGSIRRGKPFVHDIDIVCLPNNQGELYYALHEFGLIKGGKKVLQVSTKEGITVDIYIATPATWVTLLLIRTGSKEHNVQLCARARQKGLILHADGRGLCHPGAKAIYGEPAMGEDSPVPDINTEADFFKALDLPYRQPAERG
jgi:DNA polymerase/3'-5' exonuclease PolX